MYTLRLRRTNIHLYELDMDFLFLDNIILFYFKDNIREAIGEIQLHTSDNVLNNWTYRVGYCMTSPGHAPERLYFQIKKEI